MDLNELITQLQSNELFIQLQSAASLYTEILIAIAAAGLLGLFIGLMMQRSKHKRKMAHITRSSNKKYAELKESARRDSAQLEEQLQVLGLEAKKLSAKNSVLADSVRENDAILQKARAESIELNRRHTETQERLQRIIQQKDREFAGLAKPSTPPRDSKSNYFDSDYSNHESTLDDELDSDLYAEETVAMFPTKKHIQDSHDDAVVATIPSSGKVPNSTVSGSRPSIEEFDAGRLDSTLDDTADLSDIGIEDSTVALTDETLAIAHLSFKQRSKDA